MIRTITAREGIPADLDLDQVTGVVISYPNGSRVELAEIEKLKLKRRNDGSVIVKVAGTARTHGLGNTKLKQVLVDDQGNDVANLEVTIEVGDRGPVTYRREDFTDRRDEVIDAIADAAANDRVVRVMIRNHNTTGEISSVVKFVVDYGGYVVEDHRGFCCFADPNRGIAAFVDSITI